MLRLSLLPLALLALPAAAQTPAPAPTRAQDSVFVRQTYRKLDRLITMRDGVQLATIVYVPRDADRAHPYPILLERTPYGAGPRGEGNYPRRGPGPSRELSEEKYIFVYQDVRGRYLSEGQFEEMTPALPTAATDRARRAASGPALTTKAPTPTTRWSGCFNIFLATTAAWACWASATPASTPRPACPRPTPPSGPYRPKPR